MAWTPSDEEYFQRLSRTSFAPPEAPPVKQNRSAMGDLATDLKRGVQQFPSTVTGLLDIPVAAATGRALVSEGWGEIGKLTGFQPKRWSEEARAEYTPERQRLMQEAAAKEGFADTLGHYLQNPSLIAGVVTESLPSVAAGGLMARGLKSVSALGGITRAGIGEGSVMAGQSMSNMLDEGVDPRRAAGFSAAVGVGGGALGVGGGKLAQQLGLLDADTLFAGGVARAAGAATRQPLSMPRRIAGGAVSEGLFEELPQSMLETSMGNLATERPWDEDLGKSAAVGLLAGGATGGAVNIPGARRVAPKAQSPDPAQDVAGLLPPPTYTGTPSDQLLQQDVERANRVAEADARAAEIAQRRREFEAQRAAGMALAPEQQTVLEQDPAITAWAATPDAAPHLKKDGTMRSYAAKAWQAYNEMTDAEIVSAMDELAPQPKALWRVGMLEAIQAARQEEANAAPQVDAPSDLGAGTDLVRSTADAQPGPDVGRGARTAAGVPARSGGEAAPVGAASGEQPAGVAAPSDLMVPETAIAPEKRLGDIVGAGTVALPKFAPRQQQVFNYIQDAVQNGRADEVIDAEGTLMYQRIGEALGVDRAGVRKAVNGVLARLAAANGATLTEFKQALAARARDNREVAPATEARLGESPAVQDSVLDQQEVFGEGAGFGTVESVGGSQIETGEDTEATALAALRTDPVAAQRAEEARARHEAAKDWALSQPMAAVAAEDWDYYFGDAGLPKASELTRDQAYEWLAAYAEWKNDGITEEQLVAEGREIAGPGAERASMGAPATDNPQLGDGDAGARAEPAGADQAGEAGGAPALGQPAAQPIEGRVAELRARANDKQRARLDRLIQRFANREFDLERLNLELDTLEAQLPQLSTNVPTEGTTTDAIWDVLNEIGTAQARRKVTVVQGYEVLVERGLLAADVAPQVQGFVLEGKAYLIADNIAPGSERAVILHEIGAHMGLEKLLSDSQYSALVGKISQWSDQDTQEGQIARRALVRVARANVPPSQARAELIAYFIEEAVLAGIDPTATNYKTELGRWFRALWEAFKTALRRLDIISTEKLTAQDVVDLAYGAANLELASQNVTVEAPAFSIRADVREAIDRNPGLKRAETAVGQTFKAAMRNGLSGIAFTADVVRAAVRSGMSAARDFELALRAKENRAREIQIEVEDVLSAYAALPKVQQGYVDNIVYDMTFEEKWGFVPDWRQDAELDEDMARRFRALAPAAQKVTIDLFRHGDTMFRRKQDLLRQTIAGEYQALITQATDAKQKAELVKARDAELRRAGRNLSALKGPYAPLRRFGDYVVVAKSQKLRDAEGAGKTLSETDMQDSNHYQVHFAPTAAAAEQLRQELAVKFGEEGVWHGLKEEAGGQMPELPFVVVQRLRENLRGTGELESKSKRALDKLLVDLYISTLHESNARHAELQRRNRAGASKDMMRAFASQGRADSHLVSSMEHSSEIIKAMTALRSQAKQPGGDTVLKTKLRNELVQRHMMGLDYSDTPLSQAQDKLMAVNSLWMLLTSPAYYVQNATQVFLMTQPVLAARFGQMRSANALLDGARRTFETLKQSTWDEAADLSKFKGTDLEKAMLQELQKRGSLDFGISAELGYWENSGEFSKAFSRVMRKFSIGTRKLEVMNRMTSALAAYQMAYSTAQGTDQQRHSAALEYADRIIVDTHGDYSTQNAPRYFRMLPKIVTQFRKFQLIQISLFARHLRDATKGSSDEKKVAKAALAYLVMNHAVLAGGLGIPAASLMAAVYSALAGDDDDPADFEVDLRRAIGNKDLADLLLYGAPAALGVNMSQRIGAGQMLDPLPFVEYEASRGGYEKLVTAALGPMIGGLGPQVSDAAARIMNGELYQGLAQMMPRGLRDAMRGVYASQEGVKLRNGQTALTPEELSFYDSLMMGLGMPTDKTTSRQNLQRKAQQYEEFYRGRTTSLKREYTEAYNAGDGAGMQQARRDWQELQQARKANGFATQPISELLKAPRERAKAEQKLEAGVRTTEQGRGFVQSLL